ncbi:MAG: HU family DNA-binding protein [Rhodoblastus sp.]
MQFGRFGNNSFGPRQRDSVSQTARCSAGRRKGHARGRMCRAHKEQAMNKQELVEHVASEMDLSKAKAADAIDAVLDGITKAVKKGDEVRLVGFGTFSVKKRAAGKGRNPATGAEIKIPASKSVRFKAGAALKAAVNKTK